MLLNHLFVRLLYNPPLPPPIMTARPHWVTVVLTTILTLTCTSLPVCLLTLTDGFQLHHGLTHAPRRTSSSSPIRGLHMTAPTPSGQPSTLRRVQRLLGSAVVGVGVFSGHWHGHDYVAMARPEGVNRPELLPSQFTPVIDVANYLTFLTLAIISKGQEKKVSTKIAELEANKGFKLRVLLQKYPETPGLAIKDYWKVDDNTVVMVIDEGQGLNSKGIPRNIINLNIGKNAEDQLPNLFWSRLVNKLGNSYYVKDNGIDTATINAVEAITYCLQQDASAGGCKELPFEVAQ